MDASALLFLLLILACPLMMIFMMRGHGGHDHGAGGGCHGGGHETSTESLRDLRRRRDELDALIDQREAEEAQSPPAFAGRDR